MIFPAELQTVVLAASPIPSLAAGLLSDSVPVKAACGSALSDLANYSLFVHHLFVLNY